MQLEAIILREIIQSPKDKYHLFSLIYGKQYRIQKIYRDGHFVISGASARLAARTSVTMHANSCLLQFGHFQMPLIYVMLSLKILGDVHG